MGAEIESKLVHSCSTTVLFTVKCSKKCWQETKQFHITLCVAKSDVRKWEVVSINQQQKVFQPKLTLWAAVFQVRCFPAFYNPQKTMTLLRLVLSLGHIWHSWDNISPLHIYISSYCLFTSIWTLFWVLDGVIAVRSVLVGVEEKHILGEDEYPSYYHSWWGRDGCGV